MGLDTTYDAFHGSYSAFNRLRQAIATAIGGSYPPHDNPDYRADLWYWDDSVYSKETYPGLFEFMNHSDCDGEISPEMCTKVANDLETLLPKLDAMTETGGHLHKFASYGDVTRKFIAGCRTAAAENQPLEFL